MHTLRVLAVSAPHWPRRADARTSRSLSSPTPFSLQNACRLAAGLAASGSGAWGHSNWHGPSLGDSVALLQHADELDAYMRKLEALRPNLLLIGAMTLALPGAVELATRAKRLLGDSVTVVLGGKHAIETMYLAGGETRHAPSSPLLLQHAGRIPACFDLVVAGDGEAVIAAIGESVAFHGSARAVAADLGRFQRCAGTWIVGAALGGRLRTIVSSGRGIDHDALPVPAELFGFNGRFSVLGADRTAHVYSDISKGCIYDCFFCSERVSVNGAPNLTGAAGRLARQLAAVRASGALRGDRVSAFVEDSILLMAVPGQLDRLAALLRDEPRIPFGGQITVDLLLDRARRGALAALAAVGLSYLYVGIETGNDGIALGMSKNLGGADWMERNERAVEAATAAGLRYGVPVLFGLGETQDDRLALMDTLASWQRTYAGNPCVVSLNWAVEHPLQGAGQADYLAWGTDPDSPLLPLFQSHFGEASERYAVHPQLPTVDELRALTDAFDRLILKN